jgi:hypothetical protein
LRLLKLNLGQKINAIRESFAYRLLPARLGPANAAAMGFDDEPRMATMLVNSPGTVVTLSLAMGRGLPLFTFGAAEGAADEHPHIAACRALVDPNRGRQGSHPGPR